MENIKSGTKRGRNIVVVLFIFVLAAFLVYAHFPDNTYSKEKIPRVEFAAKYVLGELSSVPRSEAWWLNEGAASSVGAVFVGNVAKYIKDAYPEYHNFKIGELEKMIWDAFTNYHISSPLAVAKNSQHGF